MGTVVGAVATGRVPVHPAGNVLAAWTSPTAILTGFLFVAEPTWNAWLESKVAAPHRTIARHFDFYSNCYVLVIANAPDRAGTASRNP